MRRRSSTRVPRSSRRPLVVAVDGPSGAGKSSASRLLAERLGWAVFETGGLYRAAAWAVIHAGVAPGDERAVARLCATLPLRLVPAAATWRITVGGQRLVDQLREEAVTKAASIVAAVPAVRTRLLQFQRRLLRKGRIVMEGRDIGTVVCPEATVKFFLDADPAVRGVRRFREGVEGGGSVEQAASAIGERDRRDQHRPVAPLRAAADAVRIDTTNLTLDQVVDKMLAVLKSRGIFSSSGRLRRSPAR
jgi:cytidylate kinase